MCKIRITSWVIQGPSVRCISFWSLHVADLRINSDGTVQVILLLSLSC